MNKQAEIPTFGAIRDKNWTLRKVAERIGCSASHLSRVLSGERCCTPQMAQQLNDLPRRASKKEKALA